MNTLDTAMPKLDQQWGKINTIERPLAFPKSAISAEAPQEFQHDDRQPIIYPIDGI
jgi:hypothetical protein